MRRALKANQPTRGHGALEAYLARKRAQRANQLIPEQQRRGRLLDVGCGSYPYFLATTPFAEKWGIDQIFDAESTLQLDDGRVVLIPFDVQRDVSLPFATDFFSVVTMLAVFEHIEPAKLKFLLGEVHRVLQPGGTFVMTTPSSWTNWLLKLMARVGLVSRAEIDEHKDTYAQREIRSTIEGAGFDPGKVTSGSFEVGANLWATATK